MGRSKYYPHSPDWYRALKSANCWVLHTTRYHSLCIQNLSKTNVWLSDQPCSVFKHQKLTSPHLLGPESSFSKLLSLTSATLSQKAMNYQLGLTFLLHGVRGVGKFTVTSWVAQDLGLHLNEASLQSFFCLYLLYTNKQVDCYELLEETDTRTEATLQVRFEQASRMTPCLLVLRHLEALSQTTQSQGRDASE